MNTRTIKKISLGDADGHVIIQFMGQSQAIEAKVLELKRGDDGGVVYLLLDRLVHQGHESGFGYCPDGQPKKEVKVGGCIVSELDFMGTGL